MDDTDGCSFVDKAPMQIGRANQSQDWLVYPQTDYTIYLDFGFHLTPTSIYQSPVLFLFICSLI